MMAFGIAGTGWLWVTTYLLVDEAGLVCTAFIIDACARRIPRRVGCDHRNANRKHVRWSRTRAPGTTTFGRSHTDRRWPGLRRSLSIVSVRTPPRPALTAARAKKQPRSEQAGPATVGD